MNQDCALIVFAKAPVPGMVKTRLAPVLGAEGAARLASRMLAATLKNAVEAGIGPVELCCSPDTSHPAFQQAAIDYKVALTVQDDGNLGERMQRAFMRSLAGFPRAVLIGTDAPGLGPEALREAALALHTRSSVFAPAMDGGYVLVGLSAPAPLLFEDIAWSTSAVMEQTRARQRQLGHAACELGMQRDIDEPDDLAYLPKEWLE